MIRKARVVKVLYSGSHQLLLCEVTQAPQHLSFSAALDFQPGTQCRAVNYPELTGAADLGDTVQLEVSALAKGLGTGGAAIVNANETRLPTDALPNPGHLVKARYTPYQKVVLSADEPESPYHSLLQSADSLEGLPVLVADLHSSLPAIAAGFLASRPKGRLVYIQTDGGALPLAYSRTVYDMKRLGLLSATITCGQAFGGDYEAVSLPSAMFVGALVAKADAVVITQGPGNLGTDTRWGFSGIGGAEALRVAGALQGRPVAVLRMSNGDARPRHYGISHHSLTTLTWMGLPPLDVVVPVFDPSIPAEKSLADPEGSFNPLVESQASLLREHHWLREVPTGGMYRVLEDFPIKLSTMNRSLAEDPAAFLSAACAGVYAASLIDDKPSNL